MAEPLGMQHQLFAFRHGGGQRAQVIAGGAEAPIYNQHIRLFATFTQDVDQRLQRVAHRVTPR
ncbi:hypothetical protein D3C76_1625880 [compost metagenome]